MERLTDLLHSSQVDKSNNRGQGLAPLCLHSYGTAGTNQCWEITSGLTAAASLFRGAASVRNTQVDFLFFPERVGVLLIHFFFFSPFL